MQTVQICSGLVPFIGRDQLLNSRVVLVRNLKPSNMRGQRSEAMLLAASKTVDDVTKVEIVTPPLSSTVGEFLSFENYPKVEDPKRIKTKILQEITANLKTDNEGKVVFVEGEKTHYLQNDKGDNCFVESLADAEVH